MRLRENINWGNPVAVDQLNSMAANYNAHGMDGSNVAVRTMVNLTTQQAMVMSFSDVFMILTVLFTLMLIGVAMISKPKPPQGAPAGGH